MQLLGIFSETSGNGPSKPLPLALGTSSSCKPPMGTNNNKNKAYCMTLLLYIEDLVYRDKNQHSKVKKKTKKWQDPHGSATHLQGSR
jgi:hypothetical protein